MIKKSSFIILAVVFILSLFYLHQKIEIFIKAYELNETYKNYNELVAKRDYLIYNFSKLTSLPKVNQWAVKNDFDIVSKERVVVLSSLSVDRSAKKEEYPVSKYNKRVSLISRFLKIPTSSSTVVAQEKE